MLEELQVTEFNETSEAYPVWKGHLLRLSSSPAPGIAAFLHEGRAGGVAWVNSAGLPVSCQRRGLRCWLQAHCTRLHPCSKI